MNSLKKNNEFRFVYRNGKSYANKYLIMYIVTNHLDENHIGISVSKKVGNSVVRHRITRLIREGFRWNEAAFHTGYDIVVVARAGAKGKKCSDISNALVHLAKLHQIYRLSGNEAE